MIDIPARHLRDSGALSRDDERLLDILLANNADGTYHPKRIDYYSRLVYEGATSYAPWQTGQREVQQEGVMRLVSVVLDTPITDLADVDAEFARRPADWKGPISAGLGNPAGGVFYQTVESPGDLENAPDFLGFIVGRRPGMSPAGPDLPRPVRFYATPAPGASGALAAEVVQRCIAAGVRAEGKFSDDSRFAARDPRADAWLVDAVHRNTVGPLRRILLDVAQDRPELLADRGPLLTAPLYDRAGREVRGFGFAEFRYIPSFHQVRAKLMGEAVYATLDGLRSDGAGGPAAPDGVLPPFRLVRREALATPENRAELLARFRREVRARAATHGVDPKALFRDLRVTAPAPAAGRTARLRRAAGSLADRIRR